jgi:anti-sigma B factor antagonist
MDDHNAGSSGLSRIPNGSHSKIRATRQDLAETTCTTRAGWKVCMPSLITNHRQFGSITIVDMRGSIGLGQASLTLRSTIRDLVESGRIKIILNFSQVTSMDSAGVGELAGAYMPVKSKGGELKFLNPTKEVYEVLQITQLERVFAVYTDEQAAIRSFS